MFTNNFYAIQKMECLDNASNRRYAYPAVTATGETRYVTRRTSTNISYGSVSISGTYSGGSVHFGSGSTPATPNDYALESNISSGLSATNTQSDGIDENGKPYLRYVYTLTNTGSESITVAEIGVFVYCFANATQGTAANTNLTFLIMREVFTPVTIPVGESAAITLTIKLDEVVVSS